MTLFRNKVFANVIGYGSQEEITLDSGWASNPMTSVLIRHGEDTERHTEGKVKMAEVGVMWLPSKEHHGWPATLQVKRHRMVPPSQNPEKTKPANTSISDV